MPGHITSTAMSSSYHRPRQQQRRPATIKELSERALENLSDENKPLKHYLRVSERYRRDARDYNSKGDLENAFIYFLRAATLVLEKLPTHRDYDTLLTQSQRSNLNLNGIDMLEDLGDLKRRLTDRYEEWMRDHPEGEEPVPAASAAPDYILRSQNGHTNTTPGRDSNEEIWRYLQSDLQSERQYQYEQQPKELWHREEETIRRREQETKTRGDEEGIMRWKRESEEAAHAARSDPGAFGDTSARAGGLTTQSSVASINSSMAKTSTFDFMGELLHLFEYSVPASELSTSNIESLLDFILHALCNDKLSSLRIQNANKKARRVMFELVSKTHIIPKSLFVADVTTTKMMIGRGGFGHVFKGVYDGLPVALKVVDRGHTNDSLTKDFCRETLAWRSLSHGFILPLLGIFEEESQLFLVSPFMANGTLTEWRKKQEPNKISEIHRLMLEVAEGVKYLHSEGIIHGDLHGRNVLLNSEFHCQITDFGSTRHFEAAVTRSTTAFAMNFVAPELFGMCTTCALFDCDGCQGDEATQKRRKTMETDVYAFGCLYYATFFDSIPFHGRTDLQIVRLVTTGKRPDRLESPRMEDDTWDLIQRCWKSIPSKRSTMEDIATALASPAWGLSLDPIQLT